MLDLLPLCGPASALEPPLVQYLFNLLGYISIIVHGPQVVSGWTLSADGRCRQTDVAGGRTGNRWNVKILKVFIVVFIFLRHFLAVFRIFLEKI